MTPLPSGGPAPRNAAAADPAPAVLGALVTGAIGCRDVATLRPAAFESPTAGAVFAVLLSLREMAAEGYPVPSRGMGIELSFALRACRRLVPHFGRNCAVDLIEAARASRRGPALVALAELRRRQDPDPQRDREAFLEALAGALEGSARAWLRRAGSEIGGWERGALRAALAGALMREGR